MASGQEILVSGGQVDIDEGKFLPTLAKKSVSPLARALSHG